ncbi:MAG: PepSY domain-containing protein [Gemmatimonadales bacterium]
MRRFFLVTHRWLGLGAALFLTLAGVSGMLLVWSDSETLEMFHKRLFLGEFGEWLLIASTAIFLFLAVGGVVLWWRRKILTIRGGRGWWRTLFDLHHALGMIAIVVTLLIAGTGIGIVIEEEEHEREARVSREEERVREEDEALYRLHTGRTFPPPLKVVWALASLSFGIQALSGFFMWWKPQQGQGGES